MKNALRGRARNSARGRLKYMRTCLLGKARRWFLFTEVGSPRLLNSRIHCLKHYACNIITVWGLLLKANLVHFQLRGALFDWIRLQRMQSGALLRLNATYIIKHLIKRCSVHFIAVDMIKSGCVEFNLKHGRSNPILYNTTLNFLEGA